MNSARLLSSFEACHRAGAWSRYWLKHRMSPMEMLTESVNRALTEESDDPGQNAGEHFVTLASDRGLEISDSVNTYRCVMNHAAIADILTTAIKSQWQALPPVDYWASSCFQADGYLRRFLPVQHWSEDRELFERRSWYCLGEICHYKMPMQLVVAVVGHMSGGRRSGYFSKGLLHPQRSHLRFRRRSRGTVEGFKESWVPVYREDHAEINREKWLQCLLDDDVLREVLFVVQIEVPAESEVLRIQDLAKRHLERLSQLTDLPDRQLSTCFDPIRKCSFVKCCHDDIESLPSRENGFRRCDNTYR